MRLALRNRTPHHQIRKRHDALDFVLLIDHYNTPHLILSHQCEHVFQIAVLATGYDLSGHELLDWRVCRIKSGLGDLRPLGNNPDTKIAVSDNPDQFATSLVFHNWH